MPRKAQQKARAAHLVCWYCGSAAFPDFPDLAAHVLRECPKTPAPEGSLGETAREVLAANNVAGERMRMGKTIGQIKEERGIGGPPLLRGEDLPHGTNSVTIRVKELRLAPDNFGSPAIIDLAKEVYGKTGWAVNITNLRALAKHLGFDEPDKADFDALAKRAAGKKIILSMAMVNNPKSKTMVRSLFIT